MIYWDKKCGNKREKMKSEKNLKRLMYELRNSTFVTKNPKNDMKSAKNDTKNAMNVMRIIYQKIIVLLLLIWFLLYYIHEPPLTDHLKYVIKNAACHLPIYNMCPTPRPTTQNIPMNILLNVNVQIAIQDERNHINFRQNMKKILKVPLNGLLKVHREN